MTEINTQDYSDKNIIAESRFDVDQDGTTDSIQIVERDGHKETFFSLNDGSDQSFQYLKAQPRRNAATWLDGHRHDNLIDRAQDYFPSFVENPLASLTDDFVPTISVTEKLPLSVSAWRTAKKLPGNALDYLFKTSPNDEAELTARYEKQQLQVLQEIDDTGAPEFLRLLLHIMGHGTGTPEPYYSETVVARAERILTKLLPILEMEELIHAENSVASRLSVVTSFWEYRSEGTNLIEPGRSHVARIELLLESIRDEIRFRVSAPSLVIESDPSYISTNFEYGAQEFMRTPARFVDGWILLTSDCIEDGYVIGAPLLFIPRLAGGVVSFVWNGVIHIPGEIGSITTGGAIGPYGNELGQQAGDTFVAALVSLGIAESGATWYAKIRGTSKIRPGETVEPPIDLTSRTAPNPTTLEGQFYTAARSMQMDQVYALGRDLGEKAEAAGKNADAGYYFDWAGKGKNGEPALAYEMFSRSREAYREAGMRFKEAEALHQMAVSSVKMGQTMRGAHECLEAGRIARETGKANRNAAGRFLREAEDLFNRLKEADFAAAAKAEADAIDAQATTRYSPQGLVDTMMDLDHDAMVRSELVRKDAALGQDLAGQIQTLLRRMINAREAADFPTSGRAQIELAELYAEAGRTWDAARAYLGAGKKLRVENSTLQESVSAFENAARLFGEIEGEAANQAYALELQGTSVIELGESGSVLRGAQLYRESAGLREKSGYTADAARMYRQAEQRFTQAGEADLAAEVRSHAERLEQAH